MGNYGARRHANPTVFLGMHRGKRLGFALSLGVACDLLNMVRSRLAASQDIVDAAPLGQPAAAHK